MSREIVLLYFIEIKEISEIKEIKVNLRLKFTLPTFKSESVRIVKRRRRKNSFPTLDTSRFSIQQKRLDYKKFTNFIRVPVLP